MRARTQGAKAQQKKMLLLKNKLLSKLNVLGGGDAVRGLSHIHIYLVGGHRDFELKHDDL